MKVLIVVESWFGNTLAIGEEIASGLQETGAKVQLVRIDEAPSTVSADIDLLVLGAPTHNLGLSSEKSRRDAAERSGHDPGTGMRDWIADAELPLGAHLAVFDTTSAGRFSGSAAKAAKKLIGKKIRGASVETASFLIQATEGPMQDGSAAAARAWGRHLNGH